MNDAEVIRLAPGENRVLITNDKDFGEKVFPCLTKARSSLVFCDRT